MLGDSGDPEHEESAPEALNQVISKLICSLVGQGLPIKILPGTLAHRVYAQEEILEEFRCNYGLNPEYRG